MKITFGESALPKTGAIVVGVLEEGKLTPTAAELDRRSGGALKRAVASGRFSGKKDELLAIVAPANLALSRIVLAGLGKPSAVTAAQMQGLGGILLAHLNGAGEKEATLMIDKIAGSIEPGDAAANLAYGARLRSYRFDNYRTKREARERSRLARRARRSPSASAAGAKRVYQPLEQDRRRRLLHPRPGLRAGQRPLSRELAERGQEPWRRSASRSRCSARRR